MNTNYANLLRDFGVDDMNNCQIMAELESVLGIKITGRTEEPAQWALVQPDEESRQRVHSQLVLLRLYKRWAMSSIAAKLLMQVYEVRSFVKEYKRKLKAVIRSRADEARQNEGSSGLIICKRSSLLWTNGREQESPWASWNETWLEVTQSWTGFQTFESEMRCGTVEHVALKSWRERPGFRWRVDGSGCSTSPLKLCCGCLKRRSR